MRIQQSGSNLVPRTCRTCGRTFMGGTNALYCPECRAERRRKGHQEYHQRRAAGRSIILGVTVGHCERCGKEFVYNSANQKYCSACAPEAIAENHREKKRTWLQRAVEKYGPQFAEDYRAKRRIGREKCIDCGAPLEPGHSPNKMLCKRCEALHKQYGQYCSNNKRAGRLESLSFDEWKAGKVQCPVCGRFFAPRTKRQKYCSKECSKKAAAERVLQAYHDSHPRPKRVCPVCGREFVNGEHHYEKYCSPECRAIGRRQKMAARLEPDAPPVVTKPRWQPKPEVEKVCPVCGKTFITTYSNKKYCSKACRDQEMRRRLSEKQKRARRGRHE